jgi:hypothetical protein
VSAVSDFDALAALSTLVSGLADAKEIQLAFVPRAPRVQRRAEGGPETEQLIERARTIRLDEGIPFWHALFLEGEKLPEGVPRSIVESALYHQNIDMRSERRLTVHAEILADIQAVIEECPPDEMVVLMSRVTTTRGETRHIPMLDFSSKSNIPGAEASVRSAVRALDQDGLLVSSGRSYHFFGDVLLAENDFRDFLARALLLAPITDDRWIAHQLISGFSCLRVSDSDKGLAPVSLGRFRSGGLSDPI